MIGSSSARMKERLTDGDVIVVEVFREPLLALGLPGVLDIRLCDEKIHRTTKLDSDFILATNARNDVPRTQ